MRVLILAATTGGGHMRAADALKEYILSQDENAEIKIEDVIEYISPFVNKAVTGGYVYMAKNTPTMYGTFYKSIDDENSPVNRTVEMVTVSFKKRLMPLIEEFKPDIIVTTHSLATELYASLKKLLGLKIPIISILTDFAIHQTYIYEGVDAYVVSSRKMVDDLVNRGVERVRVYPYGIPVKQEFYKEIDRLTAFESEGLDPELPTILIMAGSFGVTDILKIYHKIVKSPEDFQIIVITGKNEKLYDNFERYLKRITSKNTRAEINEIIKPNSKKRRRIASKPTKLLYFTNEVEKYMHMADLIVTKPGGLTVTEAISVGLPMAIFKAIPGQEEQNADFLVNKNMAVRLEKDKTCTTMITRLLREPDRLDGMKKSIREFSKGNSAKNIYILMQELIDRNK